MNLNLSCVIGQVNSLVFQFFLCKMESWQIDGETVETLTDFIFVGSKSLQMVTAAMKLKDAGSLEEKL